MTDAEHKPRGEPESESRTTRLPSGTLERIAGTFKVDSASLATISVSSAVQHLYHAILEYAALSGSGPNPLVVDGDDPFEPHNDKDEDEDEDDDIMSVHLRLWARGIRGGSKLLPGKGVGKRRAQVPKFKYALGETSFVWPPPAELTPERLIALRREAQQAKSKKKSVPSETAKTDEPKEQHSSRTSDDQAGQQEESAGADAKGSEYALKEQITISLVHYSFGEPELNRRDRFVTHREIFLATTADAKDLQTFTHEVMQWRIDKDYRDGAGSKFALHRFKTDGCGQGWWEDEGLKRARPADSVVLADGQLNQILTDVQKFLLPSTKRWYVKHGLPHRRSYLFYGPPGTGKTSTIRAIASTFRLNCCFLSMTDSKFSNQMLGDALSHIPPNALLVLEDVDALFNMDRKSEDAPSLTFSGLLNALDGVISADGVLTIMTTNHLHRLDRALVRGGRVDRRFLFGPPSVGQIQDLFKLFYPDAEACLARKFASMIMDRPEGEEARSIATLQQLFIHHREDSAEECVESMPEFFKAHFPGELGGKKEHLYT